MARRKIRRFKPPVMLATVFRRAREVLDRLGWTRSPLVLRDGQRCNVVTAVAVAGNCHPRGNSIPGLLDLWRLSGFHHDGMIGWNSEPGRRKRDVIALLKRAELKAAREKARLVP